jgi:hypothetical protein
MGCVIIITLKTLETLEGIKPILSKLNTIVTECYFKTSFQLLELIPSQFVFNNF